MRARSSDASMPFPELVTGDSQHRYRLYDTLRMPWLPTNGMTDKHKRRLFTPFHPAYRYVSLHELAHVKWSPERMPELDFDTRVFQAVEDARINMGLAHLGKPLELPESDRRFVGSLVEADHERGDPGALVLRAIAGLGTNADKDVLSVATRAGSEHAARIAELTAQVRRRLNAGRAKRGGPVASPELAIRVARDLAAELGRDGLLPHGEPGTIVIGCVFGSCAHGDEVNGLPIGLFDPEDGPDANSIQSGTLRICEAPLGPRGSGPRLSSAREWRRAAEGCVLRYPHRIAIDGAVYRRAVRGRGGAVLVDTSGSMRFEREDLSALVEAARGAALVAIYGGDGNAGDLRIVARAGRRAADSALEPPGSGNIVDLPCLEWLAKQRGPRIWCSDGRATGIGDQGSAALRRECEALCRRARILRVPSAKEAEKRLRQRR